MGDSPGHPFRGNQYAKGGTFYHGTREDMVDQIVHGGIKSAKALGYGGADPNVYITPDRALAERYAKNTAALRPAAGPPGLSGIGVPVVVKIRIPKDRAAKIGVAERQPADESVIALTFPDQIPPDWILGIDADTPEGWKKL